MKTSSFSFEALRLFAAFVLCVTVVQSAGLSRPSASHINAPAHETSRASAFTQYDDPYSDFRNAHYSNSGLLNERDEIKLGTHLHREVTKKFNLTDAGLVRVDRIGQRCAKASLRPNLVYKFHVIESREINGFSLPGGHVYVTTALIKLANENELASVLAHEVGHIVARHSLKTLKQSQEYDDIAKSLGELTGVAGDMARDLGVALGRMVGEGFLAVHTRDEEREADFLGVRAMPRAGFDPRGMITMFQKLARIEEENSNLLGSLFSDHPDAEERIDSTRYEIARMKRR
ncbi:MAG TPA: M48 family metallopeptidase [Pyrinomonadaceae bacterium]|nr:M48 family metallopeptidase [Pyrinomonadaceae bacterium]